MGLSGDNEFVALARFASADAAKRNSERPEQGTWWAEVASSLEGETRFSDYDNVILLGPGGSETDHRSLLDLDEGPCELLSVPLKEATSYFDALLGESHGGFGHPIDLVRKISRAWAPPTWLHVHGGGGERAVQLWSATPGVRRNLDTVPPEGTVEGGANLVLVLATMRYGNSERHRSAKSPRQANPRP